MDNLLTVTNAPDKGAVTQTNFERIDPLLVSGERAVKLDYILLKSPADDLYYKYAIAIVDGQRVLAPTDDAGIP